ncbi:cytochrome b/b6 domain-containing protein, partial [Vibrio diabolicus]
MDTLVKNYNLTARVMHWLSALCIIGLFAVGLWMVDLSYYSEWYRTA